MGFGMATALLRAGLDVTGCDVMPATIARFVAAGGHGAATPAEAVSKADIVVSPRFHNLLLGLMMDIPAISISYDPKNDCLLEGVGLGDYRQALTELDVYKLIDQFTRLTAQVEQVKPLIAERSAEYRALLENQYELIFGEFAAK